MRFAMPSPTPPPVESRDDAIRSPVASALLRGCMQRNSRLSIPEPGVAVLVRPHFERSPGAVPVPASHPLAVHGADVDLRAPIGPVLLGRGLAPTESYRHRRREHCGGVVPAGPRCPLTFTSMCPDPAEPRRRLLRLLPWSAGPLPPPWEDTNKCAGPASMRRGQE